jgi:uncharacterized protein (DUF849 family)
MFFYLDDAKMTFAKPKILPNVMVAPNGARRTTADHPAIPVTIEQIVATAGSCHQAGAGAIHFHIRDAEQQHVLDAGLYTEALAELAIVVPEMHLQITTESVGRYNPKDMRALAYQVMPPGISIGIIEMIPDGKPTPNDIKLYKSLYEAGTRIQHICYFPDHLDIVRKIIDEAGLPEDDIWCLFTIGHYSGRVSKPELIGQFLNKLNNLELSPDWAICAFAEQEQICLQKAISLGGKVRVGFENSLFMPDGTIAENNTARVSAASALFEAKQL